ncbi:DUF4082 domain-containing protein [Catenulispora subtropica]|uniref:Ig-like domain-containing protein n=1 Tax=Catenulispora subtropica TaxID=450798 RepID=A0ABN2SZ09_9ACTN
MRQSRRYTALRTAFYATMTMVLAATVTVWGNAQEAFASCGNAVACENQQTSGVQDLTDGANHLATYTSAYGDIQGFATSESVVPGSTVSMKVQSPTKYAVEVTRLGYYGGKGSRLMSWSMNTSTGTYPATYGGNTLPACVSDKPTGLVDCGNWATTVQIQVPSTAVSGLYIVSLEQWDSTDALIGYMPVPLIVREPDNAAHHSDIVVQTSDQTWQAYNTFGGQDLYVGNGPAPDGRAYRVSYNRPLPDIGQNGVFGSEFALLYWLEENGYDVSYISGVDASSDPASVSNHKVFISSGHDEYWNQAQWNNVMAARHAGQNQFFMSGNEVFWRTRFENSIDGANTPNRTLTTYKMSKLYDSNPVNGVPDPSGQWTGTWMDAHGLGSGAAPEDQMTGTLFSVNANQYSPMTFSAAYSKMRLWRNTSVASLLSGSTSTPYGLLGYEWDSDYADSTRPPGMIDMSSTTLNVDQLRLDYGNSYGNGQATHSLVEFRDQTSHSLVFGTATVQWSWGLTNLHTDNTGVANPPNPPSQSSTEDRDVKQATMNVLADMGVQPTTPTTGLVRGTALPAGTPGPATTVTAPADGTTVQVLKPITMTGTATPAAGTVTARVEVSTDGGTTWNAASTTPTAGGAVSWSYPWTPASTGTVQVQVRSEDDNADIGTAQTLNLTVGPQVCPCVIFPSTATPSHADSGDGASVELGTKFRTSTAGKVTGVRFFQSVANTGSHTASLWTSTGQLLGTTPASTATVTSPGWQTLTFTNPVMIKANTTYVVSYHAPVGHYAADAGYFTGDGAGQPPIQALKSGTDGGNGVFAYGSSTSFPNNSYNDTNYWVDPVFDNTGVPTTPPTVTGTTPGSGATSVNPTTTVSASFSYAIDMSAVTFTVKNGTTTVPGSLSYTSATNTVVFTPDSPLALSTTFTASIQASDINGNAMTTPVTWNFTTAATMPPPACPCTLWPSTTVPGTVDSGDGNGVELGVKFSSTLSGNVTGVRFYKSAANTGTHTGTLWSTTGQQLATGTFTGESASGWQTLTFATPVAITAGTQYVVSYHAPSGHYSVDAGYFTNGHNYYPLSAPANSTSVDGVYSYGSGTTFPQDTYNASNYWVDPVFQTTSEAAAGATTMTAAIVNGPQLRATTAKPTAGKAGTARRLDPVMDPTHPITTVLPATTDPSSVKMTVVTVGAVPGQEWQPGTSMPGYVTYEPKSHTVAFHPNGLLPRNASYRVTVEADVDNDDPTAPLTWVISPTPVGGDGPNVPGPGTPVGVAPGYVPGPASSGKNNKPGTR